jgi:3-hydroxyisobutyrate dehydrogenase-like beta-hydroxyacid dehydrogenase
MGDRRRIGFVGLGIMGSRMAGTLARAGHALNVFDVDREKMEALEAIGAVPGDSPRDVAGKSDIVFSSLPGPAAVKSVYMGPDGVLHGAKPGTILIDMSTVDPETTRAVSKAAAARDLPYLDAPVSGGYREAESGSLVIIVGGERGALEKAREVLAVLASAIHHAGPSGAGNIVKLVNNVMSMGNVLVAAEAFVLGVKAGMDGQTLFDIIRTSAGRSFHFQRRFPNILARNFAPGFTVDLARKDLGLAVDMARMHDVPVPALSLIHQLYNASAALGDGPNDFASIVKVFEGWAKTQVKGGPTA